MNAREALIEKGALAVAGQEAWADSDRRQINPLGLETHQSAMRALATQVVDAVLPPVKTVAELNALPIGSVILDFRGWVWVKYQTRAAGDLYCWRTASGGSSLRTSADILAARIGQVLTLIWLPEAGDRS